MKRAAVIIGSLGLVLLAACYVGAVSGHGVASAFNGNAPSANQATPATPSLQASCGIFADGYALTLTNPGSQPVQVTGFSVTFASGGQETGSDNEPGNGTITDPDTNGPTETIGMNDWIAPGSSFTYEVQPGNGMPQADSCQLANWSDQ